MSDSQAFRDSMDEAGIKGFYHTSEDADNSEGKRVYYRVLELDASEDGALDKLTGIFESVFHGLAMRALVDPQTPAEEGSASAELIGSLRELKNLHFAE